jgi:hypothetical protein
MTSLTYALTLTLTLTLTNKSAIDLRIDVKKYQKLNSTIYMIDSDQRPESNRRPLLKSTPTDVIISNHGPI